ncbi:MAG: RNA-directed DNA polymerase [Myxococcota bacterium]
MDWHDVVDFQRAAKNVYMDVEGDWYRDPWSWWEIQWLLETDDGKATITEHAERKRMFDVSLLDVPKERFGTRPAVVIHPIDRLLTQACVDRMSVKLIGDLHQAAHGWRLSSTQPQQGAFENNSEEYSRFRTALAELSAESEALLTTDVTGCFANIPVGRVCELLKQRYGGSAPSIYVEQVLLEFDQHPNRRGLPQRSLSSCVIANLYLSQLDKLLVLEAGEHFARWMDDLYIFGARADELRRIQVLVSDLLREMELEINLGKTELLEGDPMRERVNEVRASGIGWALARDDNEEPLIERLSEEVVNRGEDSERTAISHSCTLAIKYEVEDAAELLFDVAPRLPHGADHVARLFRYFQMGSDLQHWFVEMCSSGWSEQHWALAQYISVFEDVDSPDTELVGLLEGLLEKRSSTRAQLAVGVAAARMLCRWYPKHAIDVVRSALSRTEHPMEIRALVLLGNEYSEERSRTRRWLKKHEDNVATLKALEWRSFKVKAQLPVA